MTHRASSVRSYLQIAQLLDHSGLHVLCCSSWSGWLVLTATIDFDLGTISIPFHLSLAWTLTLWVHV